MVDNSQQIWFRPIFSQSGGSCAQAAGVGYQFTYEVNRVRSLPANVTTNQYPTHFTWNFLNGGENAGSWMTDGWDIIMQCGVPTVADYGGLWMPFEYHPYTWLVWMTGYDKYYKALDNRVIEKYWRINVSTPEGLNEMKHWFSDHGKGERSGGIASFACLILGANYNALPSASYDAGKYIMTQWGNRGGHAMTIVGYNDNIKFDFNGDGQFTNPEGDMSQWEIGAVKVANSWGTGYPHVDPNSDGFVYIPYRLLAPTSGGLYSNCIHVMEVKPHYTPELVLKTKLSHSCRKKISLHSGYSPNANSIIPNSTFSYFAFKNHGGCYPMQGVNDEPIELGLDYNQVPEYSNSNKVYFLINEILDNNNEFDGIVHNFSLYDYRWGEVFELPCNSTNASLVNNGQTVLGIEYHLLPHETAISENLQLSSNSVSRFTSTVSNNSLLEINSNKRVDMYNSTIHITAGSTLSMNAGSQIVAKTGTCHVIIDGNINLAQGISFIAEEGAKINLVINNPDISVNAHSATFTRCNIINNGANLHINQCTFNDCQRLMLYGDVNIENSQFRETEISLTYPYGYLERNKTARVHNCTIFNRNREGLFIENYPNYTITNNTIKAISKKGINLFNSGQEISSRPVIAYNDISECQIGIDVYTSSGSIKFNKIYNNSRMGLRMMNAANMTVTGGGSLETTQQIRDNGEKEVYISGAAFPSVFRYNAIVDDDNLGGTNDPLLYYSTYESVNTARLKDISYNYWGSNFSPNEDLYPVNLFIYNPVWTPGNNNATQNAETMYESAFNSIQAGEYSTANDTYRAIIRDYPESNFAQASMKQLLSLEEDNGNDYSNLQNYYQSLSDSTLIKLADILANKCNEKTGNWNDAIAWYENVINNPACLEDSVFAIIDLGALYMQMNSERFADTNLRAKLSPRTEQEYTEYRDYLLSLVPGDVSPRQSSSVNALTDLKTSLQNSPNPFSDYTNIHFNLPNKGKVSIVITDFNGFVIHRVDLGNKNKGAHDVEYAGNNLKSGVYFYSLLVDGKAIATNKMIVRK